MTDTENKYFELEQKYNNITHTYFELKAKYSELEKKYNNYINTTKSSYEIEHRCGKCGFDCAILICYGGVCMGCDFNHKYKKEDVYPGSDEEEEEKDKKVEKEKVEKENVKKDEK